MQAEVESVNQVSTHLTSKMEIGDSPLMIIWLQEEINLINIQYHV